MGMLAEFVATTGDQRKHASALLSDKRTSRDPNQPKTLRVDTVAVFAAQWQVAP